MTLDKGRDVHRTTYGTTLINILGKRAPYDLDGEIKKGNISLSDINIRAPKSSCEVDARVMESR